MMCLGFLKGDETISLTPGFSPVAPHMTPGEPFQRLFCCRPGKNR
jgi:hypothetical protein